MTLEKGLYHVELKAIRIDVASGGAPTLEIDVALWDGQIVQFDLAYTGYYKKKEVKENATNNNPRVA